jgi:hypothetical protein
MTRSHVIPTQLRSLRPLARSGVGALAALLLAALPGAAPQGPVPTIPQRVVPQARISLSPDPVARTLDAFGVSSEPTPRRDEQDQALDESYSPLGAAPTLGRRAELVMVGLDLQGDDEQRSFFLYEDGSAGAPAGYYDPEILFNLGADELEDDRPSTVAGRAPQTYRAVAAGDVDGDGLDEILILQHRDPELVLRVIEDRQQGFAMTEFVVTVDASIDDVAVVAGDFDGDGQAEIAAAWAVDGVGVTLTVFDRTSAGFVARGELQLAPALGASAFSLVLEAGNVDNDLHSELMLVIDENADPAGLCRWFLYDDAPHGGQLLAGGPLTSTYLGLERTAVVGDVALGDIDGDGRDEILLAGLTAFTHGCEQPDYLVLALDDAEHGFAQLGTRHFHYDHYTGACTGGPKLVRWAHIETGDFDADGRDEIVMNQWVFEDWIEGGDWTAEWTLPASVVLSGGSWQYFDRSTSDFAVGDYTGDGRADLVTVRAGVHNAHVYSLEPSSDPALPAQFEEQGYVFCESYTAEWGFRNPLLVPVNVDTDSTVLAYDGASYRYAFSEPIVIAALAAPPYQAGIAQNYGACSTAFGNTTSSGSESERTVSLSAGVSVGADFDFDLVQGGFELEEKLTVEASRITSHAYQLDRTILFQSGWNEDLVVFTTVPMDIYTYTVLAHEDPSLVGQQIEIRLPRDPILLQADRAYYNEHLLDDGMRIDASVFQHTLGDLASYPTRAQKNGLLAQYGGLQHGPVSVGQGSGSTQVTIQVGESWSTGNALDVSYEFELKVTGGGVMGGFSVGAAASSSLRVTSGQQTTYTGTVGAIGAADFATHQYQFGLFTYVVPQALRGYRLEVLNYWVE